MGGPNGENTAFGQRAVQTGRTGGSKREAFDKENDARDIFLASQNFGMRSLARRHKPGKHVVLESSPSETEESTTFLNRRRRGSTMAAKRPKKGRQADRGWTVQAGKHDIRAAGSPNGENASVFCTGLDLTRPCKLAQAP